MFQNQIFMTFLSGISYMLAAGALSLVLTKLCIWVLSISRMEDTSMRTRSRAEAALPSSFRSPRLPRSIICRRRTPEKTLFCFSWDRRFLSCLFSE